MNITYMSINYNLTFATLTTFYLIYRKPKNQGKLLIVTSNRNVGGPRLCKRFENLLNTSGLSNCIQTIETSDGSSRIYKFFSTGNLELDFIDRVLLSRALKEFCF